jgi:hypothetical protein
MSQDLADLGRRFVGSWATEATHPLLPGETITGSGEVEWMEGQRFLIYRTRTQHPEIPDSLSVLGDTHMHYFDVRGVYRLFDLAVTADGWSITRDKGNEHFGQRMMFTFDDAGRTMAGRTQLCRDGVTWVDDLMTTYRRRDD